MITPSTFDELHASRKANCTCGAVVATPEYHGDACPYRARGEEILRSAEVEEFNEE